MKNTSKITIAFFLLATLSFTGCYDEKMEWGDPYTHPGAKDLPLELQEKISRYEALTAYTTFKLGVGIDFTLYMSDGDYRKLIDENFREITPGNEMKQSSLMRADGTLNFATADPIVDALRQAGLTIYGHTLVWHSQQRAGYLNGLIAPTIVVGPAGESLIDGDFESGMGGFAPEFNAQDYSIVDTEALSGTHSLQAIVGSGATGKYDAQLKSPSFPIIKDHRYEISFWMKSSDAGAVGIDFPSGELGNQYPWIGGTELAPVSSTWTQIVVNPETTGAMVATADNSAMTFRLLLGSKPSVTYWIDNVVVIDLDAPPAEVNYISNGNFETGDLTDWATPNAGGGITVTSEAKFEGSYGLQGIASATSTDYWNLQFQTPEIALDAAKTYTLSFWIKSDADGKGRLSFPGLGNEYPWTNWDGSGTNEAFDTNATWKQISFDFTPAYKDGVNALKFSFDLGKIAGVTYFVDDVKVVEKAAAAAPPFRAPTIIEKPMSEKAAILEEVLHNYITDVATHFAGKINAWDVVNEPMSDNGSLRPGEENLNATDVFYWQYYLGRDYAVKAFQWARQADSQAKLFINDYGLESASGAKLNGLIEYVQYIESQGATIDGIGTQLHLNINWSDTTAIASMFQKLAATGKLIKVSELDIAIANSSNPESPVAPTAEQYAQQAEMYRFVAAAFNKYIPESQRYGITVWGVSDKENEHQYWLKNDAPCLWDADYARKHAYKSFADGLAGRDVSVDFTGELVY
jgi:GH35 family endo-1,4-beta-xylanase